MQRKPIQRILKDLAILWISLLALGGLTIFLLRLPQTREWLWQHTGEEEFAAQVKGLTDLMSDQLRPRLQLDHDAQMEYADVNPFGINVFLEQEADPVKRELAVQMAADAGYHWLRQEFPWEDIEIHGRDDYEDRRHEPNRSA